jgi:cell division protein FtsL
MPAYTHGNLAVKPERTSEPKRRVVVRKKTMPVQEKVLYMFTIVVCVIVAGTIIWRYAQIYDMNLKLEKLSRDIEQLRQENRQLTIKVEELKDPGRIREMASQFGYVSPEQDMEIKVDARRISGSQPAAAME